MTVLKDPFLRKLQDPEHIRAYRHIAKAIGENCATAKALKEYDLRIAAGRNSDVVKVGNSIAVVDY